MLSLKTPDFVDVILPGGAVLKTRAVTTASNEAARAAAERRQKEVVADPEKARSMGFDPETDMKDEDFRSGLFLHFYQVELAVRHIVSWDGIADETGVETAPVSRENIEKLFVHPIIGRVFYQRIMSALNFVIAAKKDSGDVVSGISSPAAAPDTAEGASK